MHARELVEVAGLIALNGPLFVATAPSPSSAFLEQYWSASRCRFDNWNRVLKDPPAVEHSRDGFDKWVEIRAALDEIFVSEMLTRVWTAVVVARDRLLGADAADPVVRNVLATHMEARNRALALLLHPRGFNTQQAVALNRLRRRADRWGDVLVGGLLHICDVREFAVDPERADDFAIDLAQQRSQAGGRQAWRLTLVSLRNAFQTGLSPIAANPDANSRIAAGILGCFQEELFDSTGMLRSLWMVRLSASTSDAQGMIRELLEPDAKPAHSTAPRRPRRI
jgi:hypothetical protein